MPIDLGGLVGGFAQNAGEQLIAFAIGAAAAEALRPEAVGLGQEAWSANPDKALDAGTAAHIVAEAIQGAGWGAGEAAQEGINGDRFTALVESVLTAPGVPELLTLYRRGDIALADLAHGFRKSRLEGRWDGALEALKDLRLDPAAIATMVQRGILANPGLLPVGPPAEGGRVPPMPQVALDPVAEAAASGINHDRLAALTRIVGLPASPDLAARMVFRGIIDPVDFDRAIAEGNTRNEWAPFLFEAFREILTAHDYIEGRLRGWLTDAEMYAGTARHGMTQLDTDLLFKTTGRPLSFHQVWIGLRRGGTYDGPTDQIHPAFLKQLQESNIRPEWYSLAWAQRDTLPSYFVFRAIVQAGGLTVDEAAAYFQQLGWPPDLAAKAASAFAHATTGKADPHLTKAETHLWTALHRSYVLEETDDAHAESVLTTLGVADATRPEVLALWQAERELVRKTLTPSQIKKAVGEGKITQDDALARLERQGLSPSDAATYLGE